MCHKYDCSADTGGIHAMETCVNDKLSQAGLRHIVMDNTRYANASSLA